LYDGSANDGSSAGSACREPTQLAPRVAEENAGGGDLEDRCVANRIAATDNTAVDDGELSIW